MSVSDFLWNSPIAGIGFCVMTALLIFWVLVVAEKKFFPKKKSDVAYVQVAGELIKIKQKYHLSRGLVFLFIFQFTTKGGDVIEADCTPDIPNMMSLYEGAKVKICYHPNNPYNFFIQP